LSTDCTVQKAKHYRPQLPIPKALMDVIKQRFEDLTSKPIKKVAEARARKRKRSADKLKAAKKKAEALSNTDGMSEKEKLKAISKVGRKEEWLGVGATQLERRRRPLSPKPPPSRHDDEPSRSRSR
jgi:hypothetical protein